MTVLLLKLFLTLALFRLLGWPIARLALPGLKASGWALATGAALVAASHLTWLLAHLGLPIGWLSVSLGLAGVAAASLWAVLRLVRAGESLRPSPRHVLVHAVTFTAAFAFALLVTARNPSVDPDSERFMDYAMMQAVLASHTLPLEDPWLAGERVSYYDYGYYSAAYLSRFAGAPERFFPVAVALLYATLTAGIVALGLDLGGGLGALLAGFFVCVGGNLDGLAQTVRHGLGRPLDWFQSARAVAGTITEFPFFTLLWGDLHPYALALPLWPPLLAVAATLGRGAAAPATLALGAFAFAALVATHTWDAVPMAVLLVLAATLGAGRGRRPLPGALVVIGLGALLALPFLVRVPTGGRGLARVAEPSTLVELATVWGVPAFFLILAGLASARAEPGLSRLLAPLAFVAGLLIFAFPSPGAGIAFAGAALALAAAERSSGARSLAFVLAAVGAGLVGGVELVYVDDFYVGELERMNTVFKAYVAAWLCLHLALALAIADLFAGLRPVGSLKRVTLTVLCLLAVAATGVYPLRATPARAGRLLEPIGLDAGIAFARLYPDDARAAGRLRERPRGVILESTGDPYSWNGRFATFTGFPTVVGWGHHEAGWRNTWEPMLTRIRDVKEAYDSPSLDRLLEIARLYRVRYVVLGALERKDLAAAGLAKFEQLRPALVEGETVVYDLEDRREALP